MIVGFFSTVSNGSNWSNFLEWRQFVTLLPNSDPPSELTMATNFVLHFQSLHLNQLYHRKSSVQPSRYLARFRKSRYRIECDLCRSILLWILDSLVTWSSPVVGYHTFISRQPKLPNLPTKQEQHPSPASFWGQQWFDWHQWVGDLNDFFWRFQICFMFHPYLGRWSNLTRSYFLLNGLETNHQLVFSVESEFGLKEKSQFLTTNKTSRLESLGLLATKTQLKILKVFFVDNGFKRSMVLMFDISHTIHVWHIYLHLP